MATYNIVGFDSTNNLPIVPASSDTANIQGDLTVANNAIITGDLTVNGTTTTVNAQITTADDYIHLNSTYTNTAAAADSGFIFTVQPSGTVFTSSLFENSDTVRVTANPSAAFAIGDIVQISGASTGSNNGLYEVAALSATQIAFKLSVSTSLANICQNVSFTNENDTGASVVKVKVMQFKTDQANNGFKYKYGSTASNMSADQSFGGAVTLTDISAGSGNASLTTGTGDITIGVDSSQAIKVQINTADKVVFDGDLVKLKAGNELYIEDGSLISRPLTFAGGSSVALYDLICWNPFNQASPASANGAISGVSQVQHQVIGVALAAGGATPTTGKACINPGEIVPMNFGSDLTSGDTGKAVYLSVTNGRATLTAPSSSGDKVVRVGFVFNGSSNLGTTGIHSVIFQPQFISEIA